MATDRYSKPAEPIAQLRRLARQPLHQTLPVFRLIDLDLLAHVRRAVLQEAIHPLRQFARAFSRSPSSPTTSDPGGRASGPGERASLTTPPSRPWPSATARPMCWASWRCPTAPSACRIGRITPAGLVAEFPIPTVNSNPQGITAGPDGTGCHSFSANSQETWRDSPVGSSLTAIRRFPIRCGVPE